jgi:hypothetical protein
MNSSASFSANGWNAVDPAQVIAARFGPHPVPAATAAHNITALSLFNWLNMGILLQPFLVRVAGFRVTELLPERNISVTLGSGFR